ncbi:hypothetical protein B0T20DRAFT_495956 [Sordaria brevicollis]|uniref:Apple domain-containing protein n=1 Tax=Sordaria brevicollis TaxID=83679 RepID=A0AAE0UD39_SORBR|nr:hypothetical protein B0T20DRAFT_495956 [Sordaria brevicollis]
MKVTLSSFIVAVGLSSMTTATPLHHAARHHDHEHEGEGSSSFSVEHHSHIDHHGHKPTFTGDYAMDTGIMRIQTETRLTQTGITLVYRHHTEAAESPLPSTFSDFRPREGHLSMNANEFTESSTASVTEVPTSSVTWIHHGQSRRINDTRADRTKYTYTRSATYGSSRHFQLPPQPTWPVARALEESESDGSTHVVRREVPAPDLITTTAALSSNPPSASSAPPTSSTSAATTSTITAATTTAVTTSANPSPSTTAASSSNPPSTTTSALTTNAPSTNTNPGTTVSTTTASAPTTLPSITITTQTPTCPSASNNIWCLAGQTFYLECDTDHVNATNFGSITLPSQSWEMYGRCATLCAAVPDEKCTGFSYVWASGMCYLKEGEEGKRNGGGEKREGIHGGRVVKLKVEEVGNCLGVKARVGVFGGLPEGVRKI